MEEKLELRVRVSRTVSARLQRAVHRINHIARRFHELVQLVHSDLQEPKIQKAGLEQ